MRIVRSSSDYRQVNNMWEIIGALATIIFGSIGAYLTWKQLHKAPSPTSPPPPTAPPHHGVGDRKKNRLPNFVLCLRYQREQREQREQPKQKSCENLCN